METLTSPIRIRKVKQSRLAETDFDNLAFGNYVSDHMLVCDYDRGEWQPPLITPLANLSLSPATLALHYGQTVFEGMKAFRLSEGPNGQDGHINIFRAERHYHRFVKSLDRMCMPAPPREFFMEGLKALVQLDKEWVPRQPGAALYLRPFMYASEAKFGIKISDQYRFVVFTGPVAELYAEPIRVKVESRYVRAARGGTGFAKCGGNYGGALYPTKLAKEEGYDQVLWTDAGDHRFIEESGSMNVMFVIENTLVTPPVSDSILDGVTRESLMILAEDLGYRTAERPVAVEELESAFRNNTITEAFGAGTAAVVAPIRTIGIHGTDFHLPPYTRNSLLHRMKRKLEQIRTGTAPDVYGWNYLVN